jgi:hypothetical protein
MKLDKDTLLKQRFWLLLALSVPLAVIGLVLLSTSVPSVIAKERKEVDKALSSIKTFGDPKSREWVELADQIATAKEKEKVVVWKQAASKQTDLMTWPTFVEEKYHFRDGLFARDITATRRKEDLKGNSAAKDDLSHYHGVIKEVNQDWIKVEGADKKLREFLRTPGVKVQITADTAVANPTFDALAEGDRVTVTYEHGKYFGDKLTDNERTDYAREYKSQLEDIIKQVEPVNAKGVGVVQFPDWVWKPDELPPRDAKFFRYVGDDWKLDYDFSDEAWMAQEDLWVQREVYRLVRAANDSVAKFDGKGGSELDKEYVFKNPYWQLSGRLTTDGKGKTERKLKVKIKNLLDQRQDLDVTLLMTLAKGRSPVRVKIEGVARGPMGTTDSKAVAGDTMEVAFDAAKLGMTPQGVFAVEQVLTWKTAAVKRIDNVSMGSIDPNDCSLSQRLVAKGLKPFRPEEKKPVDPNAPPAPPPGAAPTGPVVKLTPNGLISERYLEVTQQARRIPVAVVLIVDQQHVERVQTAFTDSSLRFLLTQVVMNRYPGSMRPAEPTDPNAAPTPAGAPPGPVRPPRRPFFPRGIRAGPGAQAPAPDTATASSDEESNVELVLYGIVSLYERYPPRASATPLTP